jgi:hypothetical protein
MIHPKLFRRRRARASHHNHGRLAHRNTTSKPSASDAEQHSTSSGSSLVTLAKLELPQYSPTNTSRWLACLCMKMNLFSSSRLKPRVDWMSH